MFSFPSPEEWNEIDKRYPFDRLRIADRDLVYSAYPEGSFENFTGSLTAWRHHLHNRLAHARWSWVLLIFHFDKGIPDDEWFISPGRSGASAEYFPHFEPPHRLNKLQFDYYSDVFYYKLISALDTFGHLLNTIYGLEIERPGFHSAVHKLRAVRPDLHRSLSVLTGTEQFRKMKKLRNDITHNQLPGGIGALITKIAEGDYSIGVGNYTPSKTIVGNTRHAMDLVAEALQSVSHQIDIDTK